MESGEIKMNRKRNETEREIKQSGELPWGRKKSMETDEKASFSWPSDQ